MLSQKQPSQHIEFKKLILAIYGSLERSEQKYLQGRKLLLVGSEAPRIFEVDKVDAIDIWDTVHFQKGNLIVEVTAVEEDAITGDPGYWRTWGTTNPVASATPQASKKK